MRKEHQQNPNPLIERIVQAYLKTHLTDLQFEALVEEALREAKGDGSGGDYAKGYEKGFSDGYDSSQAEK